MPDRVPDRRLPDHPTLGPLPPAAPAPFTFDGRPLTGRTGETLAAALLAAGVDVFRTMSRSGEPRGGWCLVGRCPDCLVELDGRPNTLACVTRLQAGMRVATQRGLGEFGPPDPPILGGDDGASASFTGPAGENGRGEPVVRRCQVAVVGGGPAGLAAAIAAAGAGAEVVLLDEWPDLGGRLRYEVAPVVLPWESTLGPLASPSAADRLAGEAVALGVDLLPGRVAWGIFENHALGVAPATAVHSSPPRVGGPGGPPVPSELRPQFLILAAGSTDLPCPFPGSTLPGVWSARALAILLNRDRVLPGRRIALLGAGPEVTALAETIRLAGAEVAIAADPSASVVSAEGEGQVRAVVVDGRRVAIDAVAVAVGRQADAALALIAGAAFGYEPALGGHVPALDADLRATIPGLLVAGDAAGPTDPATALAEGRLAGLAAAAALGLLPDSAVEEARVGYEAVAGDRVAARRRLRPAYVQPHG